MNDIEIARSINLEKIEEIAKKIGLSNDEIEQYGKYKAKINHAILKSKKEKKDGKLILVTAINPTPLGEGKTTTSIGLADGLKKIGKNVIVTLREPSLGPVFGLKGGATGGGYAQVAPMVDINLHFNGDIHAITAANNLISAIIDNHIFQGNILDIKTVTWKRCLDLNDRQLRKVETGLSGEKNMSQRTDGFDITVASEIMAILCLAEDLNDLKRRIGNIIIGYNSKNMPVTVKDLKADGAVSVLLKDAFNPNLVQTLEHTPSIIHGGPFANIAHGCNSLIATKISLKLADYVVTEAGFGADLGCEKFLDIKCRKLNNVPNVVVCVATIRALKYHGGQLKDEIETENIDALKNGLNNLFSHINNITKKFGLNVIVAINKFKTDTASEINFLTQNLKENEIDYSIVESWEKGSEGSKDLAEKVKILCEKTNNFKYIYQLEDSIKQKINKVCTNIYGAKDVIFSEKALEKIEKITALKFGQLPICIAKTPLSFSDDPKMLECTEPFNIHVSDIEVKAGAEFIVVYTGKIMTMPGLPKKPAAEGIDIDSNGNIIGIY